MLQSSHENTVSDFKHRTQLLVAGSVSGAGLRVWSVGSGLVPREKFKSISCAWAGLLAVTWVTTLYSREGEGARSSNNPTCWQTCYHREGCLGKIPITHNHVPGLINFIIPNPSAVIESLRTNVQRPHSQFPSWLLLFICLPSACAGNVLFV